MKKFFLLLVMVVFALYGCMSYEVVKPEERKMVKIFEFQGMKKGLIFDKTLDWMAKTFVSSKSVIEVKDKKRGKIIGNGRGTYSETIIMRPYSYTVTIDIKDNKARMTFENFVAYYGDPGNMTEPHPVEYKGQLDLIKEQLNNLAENYSNYLKSKKSSEEW